MFVAGECTKPRAFEILTFPSEKSARRNSRSPTIYLLHGHPLWSEQREGHQTYDRKL